MNNLDITRLSFPRFRMLLNTTFQMLHVQWVMLASLIYNIIGEDGKIGRIMDHTTILMDQSTI